VAESAAIGVLPLVIKVGGSLLESGRLRGVLDVIAGARILVVVVPGGGPFADSVRDLQRRMNFNDAVAHRLALLSMQQMGELMVSQKKGWTMVHALDDLADVIALGDVPVWAPFRLIAEDEAFPASWAATSDSVAARLAELLGGAPLALIKSIDVEGDVTADDLARQGVVDSVFPSIVARAGLSWSIFGPGSSDQLAAVLDGQGAA
jgi:5-(aminomethyl)-3-furanmethanol phosphate kinase